MTTFRARVKPLEWSFGSYAWVAESCFGSYVAADDGSAKFANERCANHRGDGLEGAKAACQRDHDACVRALLIIEEEHDTDR